ncbi:F-box protein [Cardamine amara subsp. amara]|uniref:F-box protein n=1 Tax=Cardamine amara subsp. amara TaxID=228776 RepID=A0ABD0ZY94_CARAN
MSLDWSCSSSTCLVEEGPARHIEPIIKRSVRVSNSCDGLLCIFYKDILTTPIIVTNPAMGKSQTLPLSMIQQQYLDKKMPLPKVLPIPGFGKDSVTGTCKLVWLHDHPTNKISLCEVFDFEVNKWSYVTMDTPYEIVCRKTNICKGMDLLAH